MELTQEHIKEIDKQLALTHKHYNDDRPKEEVELSNRLVRTLSELNFASLRRKPVLSSKKKSIRKEDLLYVCLPGVPPFQEQFKFLSLPGECLYFKFLCFQKGYNEADLSQLATEFDEQAKQLHLRINKVSLSKPIVFVHHSFGSYTLASYCQQFGSGRIVGFIDAGGAPIRFNNNLKEGLRYQSRYPFAMIKQNLDQYFKTFTQRNKRFGITPYQNKYQVLGICRSVELGTGVKTTFQWLRHLPKVLKCFIFGRKDAIFPEEMINEKIVHYCYKDKFENEYQQRIKKAYQQSFGVKCNNVQQRFAFSFEEGHHSIHMSKKHKETVSSIVNHYLSFIEQVYAEQQPRL